MRQWQHLANTADLFKKYGVRQSREGSKLAKQTEANKRWQEKNRERTRYLRNRSTCRSFIKNQATKEDLEEIEELIKIRRGEIVMTGKIIGNLWNEINIEIVEIDGKMYALHGWNGEYYGHCWEVLDKHGHDKPDTDVEYSIIPIYEDGEDGDFTVIGYELI